MLHRSSIQKCVLSSWRLPVTQFVPFKSGSDHIFHYFRTERDASNKALLSHFSDTLDPRIDDLLLVLSVEDIQLKLVLASKGLPWPTTDHIGDLLEGDFTDVNRLEFEIT